MLMENMPVVYDQIAADKETVISGASEAESVFTPRAASSFAIDDFAESSNDRVRDITNEQQSMDDAVSRRTLSYHSVTSDRTSRTSFRSFLTARSRQTAHSRDSRGSSISTSIRRTLGNRPCSSENYYLKNSMKQIGPAVVNMSSLRLLRSR